MAGSESYTLSKIAEDALKLTEITEDGEKSKAQEYDIETFPFNTEDDFTDLILEVEGQQLYTNRSLLAYASPVFSCMFTSAFKEKNEKSIALPEKEYRSVSEMLSFLHPGVNYSITRDSTFRLIPLAEEYQLSVLKTACEDYLLQDIKKQVFPTVDFILKCLSIAEKCLLSRLQANCITRLTNPDISLRLLKKNQEITIETKTKIFERRIDKLEKEREDAETWKIRINSVKQRLKDIISPHDDHCRCRIEVKLRSPIQRSCPYCSRIWCSENIATDAYKNSYQFHCNHKVGYHIAHDATVRAFLEQDFP